MPSIRIKKKTVISKKSHPDSTKIFKKKNCPFKKPLKIRKIPNPHLNTCLQPQIWPRPVPVPSPWPQLLGAHQFRRHDLGGAHAAPGDGAREALGHAEIDQLHLGFSGGFWGNL